MGVSMLFMCVEIFLVQFLLRQYLGQVKDKGCSQVGGVVVNIMRRGNFHNIKSNQFAASSNVLEQH